MKPCDTKIELITCESGDWEILKVNGLTVDVGHTTDWKELIKFLGYNFVVTEISNEEMENNSYE